MTVTTKQATDPEFKVALMIFEYYVFGYWDSFAKQ